MLAELLGWVFDIYYGVYIYSSQVPLSTEYAPIYQVWEVKSWFSQV